MTHAQPHRRDKFQTRTFLLRAESQRDAAMALLGNLPLDPGRPLEAVVREPVKPRKPDQNALMWSGPLADIAGQAWLNGRQFSADAWHYHFKVLYLPEEFDPELCLEGYRKWDYVPNGDRVLIGSTTQLTVRGFAIYLQQVEAFGAQLGVEYHTKEAA